MRLRTLTWAGVMIAAAACQKRVPPAGPNVVTITATDFAFGAPDTIPAGLTTFVMVNQGQEPHQVVIQGAAGKTFEELEAGMMAEGPIPEWVRFPGGPGVAIGGDSSNATSDLAPGNYMLVCYISSPDGKMHVMKGMARRLVVAPAAAGAPARTEPKADVVVTLSDYAFAFSTPLTAGPHTIRVDNQGPQLHEISMIQLAPGKTFADMAAWEQGGRKGEPPARPVGGFIGPNVGSHGYFTVTLTPGNYALVCFVPDAQDGKPHLMHGMMQEIAVS